MLAGFRIAAVLAIVWMVIEQAFPDTMQRMPFAGDGLRQLAVLFLLTYVCMEVIEVIKGIRYGNKSGK